MPATKYDSSGLSGFTYALIIKALSNKAATSPLFSALSLNP